MAQADASEPLILEQRGSVALLVLNRPAVHNAVNAAMMKRLEQALETLERWQPRVVIVTGAGERSFCAGADLGDIARHPEPRYGREMSRRMKVVLSRLADGPRPVIAAVNGNTLGGGCEVLLACHLRIAVASARFGFRQAAMGVVTGWGGMRRALRLLGRGPALRLLLTAETIDAAEAQRLGLVDGLVERPDQLMEEALSLAQRIAANAEGSVAAFLELARVYELDGPEATDERETERFSELWSSAHFRRRVAEWASRSGSAQGPAAAAPSPEPKQ
ncbi:MAG: enoyl-CoA hydratase/isomerase family protein [Acidobacteriota bacterium]